MLDLQFQPKAEHAPATNKQNNKMKILATSIKSPRSSAARPIGKNVTITRVAAPAAPPPPSAPPAAPKGRNLTPNANLSYNDWSTKYIQSIHR